MTDYTLYYWPIPFRGYFIRSALAQAGATCETASVEALRALKTAPVAEQPVPHMAPPVLIDHGADVALAQTAAILAYLGAKHGLLPADPAEAALTLKLAADADDVLYEMTRHNGAQMWDPASWDAFQPRLARWMAIFEEQGRRAGLTAAGGWFWRAATPGLADLTVHALWGVMVAKLPALRPTLEANAPLIAALCDRVGALPEQAALWEREAREHGDGWCGGQIEASLRKVLAT